MGRRIVLGALFVAGGIAPRTHADQGNSAAMPVIGDVRGALRYAAGQESVPAAIPGEVNAERKLSAFFSVPVNDASIDEYVSWLQRQPPEQQNEIVAGFARNMGNLFREKRFDEAIRFAFFLLKYDEHNGHATYFLPEIIRSRAYANKSGFDAAKKQSHEYFQSFLDFAAKMPELTAEGAGTGIEECYKDSRGYCRQRAGWICHRLALDYMSEGQADNNPAEKLALFVKAKDKARCALEYYPGGFGGSRYPDQGTATGQMINQADTEIAALQ